MGFKGVYITQTCFPDVLLFYPRDMHNLLLCWPMVDTKLFKCRETMIEVGVMILDVISKWLVVGMPPSNLHRMYTWIFFNVQGSA